jgi:KRI1-like family
VNHAASYCSIIKATLSCRVDKLAAVSGKAAPKTAMLQQLLNSDFDPAAWDAHMDAAFGDEYYAEAEREDDVRADATDMARELASWQGEEGGGSGVAALHSRLTGSAAMDLPETDYAEGSVEDSDAAEEHESESDGQGASDSSNGAADGADGDAPDRDTIQARERSKEEVRTLLVSAICTACDAQARWSCLGSVACAL